MPNFSWQQRSLIERVRWLRYVVPPALVIVVVIYQLGITQWLERNYGHGFHYGFEIGFYSLLGPAATLFTLTWVEHRLQEKEQLERKIQVRTQQLASLTAASADAILSLNIQGNITSWNKGAERMLGYTALAVHGWPLSKLLPEAHTLVNQSSKHGSMQVFETTALSNDGHALTVELTHTRLAEVDEVSPASLIIMRDVTIRREREAVREEERARIARDLHDGVAQTLYFMALKADMARQQLMRQPDQLAIELEEIGRTSRQVIREVRRTIFALRPLDWAAAGFLSGLRHFVSGFAEQVGWQAEIDIDENISIEEDSVSIPSRLEPTIFRLVQESLNNVAKHAQAGKVQVKLYYDRSPGELVIEVDDDGSGFEPAKVEHHGLGLRQMQDRVNSVGGDFQLSSAPGQGARIIARLPTERGYDE